MVRPFSGLPRRQRFLALAMSTAAAFVLVSGVLLWMGFSGNADTYRPGADVDGISTELARALPADAPRITFTDVSAAAGIEFRHFPGRRTTRLPEDMGSGAAWADYDGDGWLDLYVVNQAGPLDLSESEVARSDGHAALYRNRGDGTFEERSRAAGVDFRGTGMAAAWADFDDDGHPDLMVSYYGGLVLYRNRGDGTFRDVTDEAGLGPMDGYWAGVSWADYDRDGDVDVYVTGYVRYEDREDTEGSPQYDIEQPASLNPSAFEPERNLLLRNQGDGTLTEVAREAGVADPHGRGLSAAWVDLDEDGWPDLYVANDVSDNRLFRNLGDGTFQDISHPALVADYRGAMGIAVGDWDGDTDADLFITHWIAQENALYSNQRSRPDERGDIGPRPESTLRFMDEADRHGLGQIALDYVGWGTSFFDYDNDGRLDLLVINGSTFQREDDRSLLVPMRDQLFWNGGARRGFFDVSALAGAYFGEENGGRGAAFADYDNDGDEDVFIVNHGGRGVLLRNDAPADNAWIQVELEGRQSNRSALGVKLRVVANGAVQVRQVGSQPSYLSQSSPVQHIGLGAAADLDTLEVRWPSGAVQVFTGLPVRTRIRLVEGGQPRVTRMSRSAPQADVGAEPAGAPSATSAAGRPDERARVRSFWWHYREATTHRGRGRLEPAAEAYRSARALDPDHEDTLYYLGSILLDLGRFPEAQETLELLVRINPRSARGHARLGTLYLCRSTSGAAEWLDAAEEALLQAAQLNREETGIHLRLAEVALVREDAAAAALAVQTVLGSNPSSGPAHFLRGYLAWLDERPESALESFRAALDAAGPPGDGLVSGEGDTEGDLAMTASAGACASFLVPEPQLRRDRTIGSDLVPRLMERRYREFADRLERLRGTR